MRLGLINSGGKQGLVAIVLSRERRLEVANYDNVAVPTNLDVADGVRRQFGGFYASLFDRVVGNKPRAVATEYACEAQGCDPCPSPPLDETERATRGDDVMSGDSNAASFVITRLHARYGKDTLADDLHFRPARPITGGREGLGTMAQESSSNDFQARYVIRAGRVRPFSNARRRSGHQGRLRATGPGLRPRASARARARHDVGAALTTRPHFASGLWQTSAGGLLLPSSVWTT